MVPSQLQQGSRGGHLRDSVGSAGNGLVATLALPDTNSLALDGFLSAEGADVAGVLLDFHLLHLLTQGGTVSVVEHIVSTNHSHLRRFSFFFFAFDSKIRLRSRKPKRSYPIDFRHRIESVLREGSVKAYLVPYLPVIPTSEKFQSVFYSILLL